MMRALLPVLLTLTMSPAMAQQLTIERLFASPSLSGPELHRVRVAPGGGHVAYLRGRPDDREQLDLWIHDVAAGKARRLVDSVALAGKEQELSETEKARRERQRIAGLRGIVDHQWSEDGRQILFMLQGDVFGYRLSQAEVSRITQTKAFETDPKLSPDGTAVAFIRDQNLVVIELDSGRETVLTRDGGGTVHNGQAEFVAQEEMDRDTGYWWSPDSRRIAYIQYDEAPVALTQRFDINAGGITVIEQRYPYTGEANVRLKLGVIGRGGGQTRWLDTGPETDIYLPRVKWLPDSRRLSYQWQARDQRRLELRIIDLAGGEQTTVLTETSDTWINLHSDLRFLEESPRFLWTSERDGFRHLYLYDLNGRLVRQLTRGEWVIDRVEGVDESRGRVYFTGNRDAVNEKQLYAVGFRDGDAGVERISQRAGWHEIGMALDASIYVDTFSSRARPPGVSLHDASGERLAWLLENRIGGDHPYQPYAAQHRPTEFGTLETGDGATLHYRMIKPPDFDAARRYPVFVYVYGGPGAQVVQNNWSSRLLFEQYMARRGFIVFSLDNRGSARRGKAFEDPIHRRLGDIEVRDQLRGIDHLRSLPYVDAGRIGLFGWSYGGYMTLMSLARAPEVYALGVAVAPVTDWRLYDTHYTERYLGTPAANPAGYQQSEVLSHTGNLPAGGQKSLLVIHGMADDNVLFTHSTLLFKDLQDKGKLYSSLTYPGARHGISGSTAQTHVYRSIAAFFERLRDSDSKRHGNRSRSRLRNR